MEHHQNSLWDLQSKFDQAQKEAKERDELNKNQLAQVIRMLTEKKVEHNQEMDTANQEKIQV